MKTPSKKPVFVICCTIMADAVTDFQNCCPSIMNAWPPYLISCDADREEQPLAFCPWCGKKIEKAPQDPLLAPEAKP